MEEKKQEIQEKDSIYVYMQKHRCEVDGSYVIIHWDEGRVCVPIPAFLGMLDFLSHSTHISGMIKSSVV